MVMFLHSLLRSTHGSVEFGYTAFKLSDSVHSDINIVSGLFYHVIHRHHLELPSGTGDLGCPTEIVSSGWTQHMPSPCELRVTVWCDVANILVACAHLLSVTLKDDNLYLT